MYVCVCVSPFHHPIPAEREAELGKMCGMSALCMKPPLAQPHIFIFIFSPLEECRNVCSFWSSYGTDMGNADVSWGHSRNDRETEAAKKGDARLCYWSRSWESHRQTNCRLAIPGRGQPSSSLLLNLTTPWAGQPHFGSFINDTPLLNVYRIILGALCLRISRCVQYLLTVKTGRGIQQKSTLWFMWHLLLNVVQCWGFYWWHR